MGSEVGRWGEKGGWLFNKYGERKELDGEVMERGKMQYGVRKERDGMGRWEDRKNWRGKIGRGKMREGVWKGRGGAVG